ncbi:MAG: hypothetical protein SOX97_09020 [Sutterella sp.]|nr:hypothetical protein [Sutterella sp.]
MNHGSILISITRSGDRFRTAVVNGRTPGVLNALSRRPDADLRRMTTLLYGLCPAAHLVTLDAARRAAAGISEDERRKADGGFAERALMLEALLENIRVLTMDAGRFMTAVVRAETLQQLGRLRSRAAAVLQTLLAAQAPGGVPDAAVFDEASRTIRETAEACGPLLYDSVFEMTPDAFLNDLTTPGDLDAWANAATQQPAGHLMSRTLAEPDGFGLIDCGLLPQTEGEAGIRFADEILHRISHEPGFDMAPVWQNEPKLTGAVVRQRRHPLIRAMAARSGVNGALLLAARLLDTASLCCLLSGRASKHAVAPAPVFSFQAGSRGGAVAMAQTARGLLIHAVGLRQGAQGTEPFHGVISPTEWQFAPEGPAARALSSALRTLSKADRRLTDEEVAEKVRLAFFALDACVPLDIQVRTGSVEAEE